MTINYKHFRCDVVDQVHYTYTGGVKPAINSIVMCVVKSCSKRSGRDKDVSFYRIPKVIYEKGPQNLLELSKRHRAGYLAAISRVGMTEKILCNDTICSRHFNSGKPADLEDETNRDWLPSLNLGYTKFSDSHGQTERYGRRKTTETAKENGRDIASVSNRSYAQTSSSLSDQDSGSIGKTKECRTQTDLSSNLVSLKL